MNDLMDILDDYILGPFNLIDRVEGLLSAIRYRDAGHQFTIRRMDKGGSHSLNECEAMLRVYGIAVYGRTHDATHMYFHTKRRQADWAEYVLLSAGVELVGEPVNPRNAATAGSRSAMPTPWATNRRK